MNLECLSVSQSHMNRVHTISGRDRDSQMIPGAWTQSSVANPAYGTRTCMAEFAPRRARNDCAKTGTVSSGAQTGGETGGWRRGCRGKTRAVRCPPTPLAPSASVRSIAGWVCGVCGVCGGGVPACLLTGPPLSFHYSYLHMRTELPHFPLPSSHHLRNHHHSRRMNE